MNPSKDEDSQSQASNGVPMPTDQATPLNPVTPEASGVDVPLQQSESVSVVETISQPEGVSVSQPESTEVASVKKTRKPLVILLVILIITIIAGAGCFAWFMLADNSGQPQGGDQPSSDNPVQDDSDKLGDSFDLTFLRLEGADKNIVYSPLSIKYALAMLSDAANGESKTQISNLIGDYQPTKYTNNEHRSFANVMFVRDTKREYVLDSYVQTLGQKYDASVISDPFNSVAPFNNWISEKTLNIINNMLSDSVLREDTDFILINALAIDMNWNNQIQCAVSSSENAEKVPCKGYHVRFPHEKYAENIFEVGEAFHKMNFNGNDVDSAEIGTTVNRYDIINELGEEKIRSTVLDAYEKWKVEENNGKDDKDFTIDKYIEELGKNYGTVRNSTDFYFSNTDEEKVFAKDLQEYDGSTLQYVGIMPSSGDLSSYVKSMTAEKLSALINNMKDVSEVDNFKDGVVTRIKGTIPFFNFDYDLSLSDDLKSLGVVDVFDEDKSDLSRMTSLEYSYIHEALHKANIEFSNDGIRAAAATAIVGGMGSGGAFDYQWEIPIEDIDLTFDKPFLFIVRDKASGEIWFAGTVYTPAN